MMQIVLFFAVQILKRKSDVYIFEVPQGDNGWNSKRRKDNESEDPKNVFVCEIHYSKYQLIKSMYKIIASLFLQKSLNPFAPSFEQQYLENGKSKNCLHQHGKMFDKLFNDIQVNRLCTLHLWFSSY